ncbi:hypothetical protein NON20_20340 [Synechocystis sp. B12]|nr:hypothetical protein NON20_20340 [Synechocystis sp. B12]
MVYRKIERYNYHAILGSLCHSLPPGIQPRYAVPDAIAGKDPAAFGGFGRWKL